MDIKLINCSTTLLQAAIAGDDALAAELQASIPQPWTEFGEPAFRFVLAQLQDQPGTSRWWTYFPIETESNTLLGTCGYKGPPNSDGEVEIGYEVAESFRNKGLATEMAVQLVQMAFQEESVATVTAHTLAEENASVAVLKKCGFSFIQEVTDEDEGAVWKWKLERKDQPPKP